MFHHPTERDLNEEDWGAEFDEGYYFQLEDYAMPMGAYDSIEECMEAQQRLLGCWLSISEGYRKSIKDAQP